MFDHAAAADPVVIVGMAVEAPGAIHTAESYWELLSSGREALSPFPTDRGWRVRELLARSRRNGFKEIHDCGGFLAGATAFDPEFFSISPREAVAMDPQQRVALRVSWRALENSGINPDDLAGHDAGCFVGASATGYGPQMTEFSLHSGHLLAGTRHIRRVVRTSLVGVSARRTARRRIGSHRRVGASRPARHRCAFGEHRHCGDR